MSFSTTFHWFDLVLVLAFGVSMYFYRHSNSVKQILGVLHWLLVFVISAFVYKYPASWLMQSFDMRPDVAALIIYPLIVALFYFLLGVKRKSMARDADKVEMFGRQEYRVAMFMGALKTVAITLVVIAWVHGRYVTPFELEEYEKFCQENFGSIRWPTLSTVQRDIFSESFSGKAVEKYMKRLMVAAVPPTAEQQAATIAKAAKEKEVKLPSKPIKEETADAVLNDLAREKKTNAASPQPMKIHEINYGQLSLKGITGTGARRMALINNQTLRQGDTDFVKVEDRKVKVFCQEIRDNSVLVRVDDKPQPLELLLNARKAD